MEVILLKEVSTLGDPGDILKVKNGYAQNYLFPQKLAVRKTSYSLSILEKQKDEFTKIIAEKTKNYSKVIDRIKEIDSITIAAKASKEGKIFGSIKEKNIEEHLSSVYNLVLQKKNIIIPHPIKTIGEHSVAIMLNKSFKTELKVILEAEAL